MCEYLKKTKSFGKWTNLQSMSLEFGTHSCGLKCLYCYNRNGFSLPSSFRDQKKSLSVKEIINVVDQAIDLGLSGIGIIGPYEPIREKNILALIKLIRERNLRVTVFTKGIYLNEFLAKELYKNDVTLGISVHSLNPLIHDDIVGSKGIFKKTMLGLDTLLRNGYQDNPNKILIQTVIVRNNLHDLPEVWKWAKDNGYVPFFEKLTVQGIAKKNFSILNVLPEELKKLFYHIAKIDKEEFNNSWIPHPPWVGTSCERHLNSCHITYDGFVQPCTGVDIPIGNIREVEISTILNGSKVIQDLRNIRNNIKGTCKSCLNNSFCYGCRGQAYQLTGDYLASDPCCWNNKDSCDEKCSMTNKCNELRSKYKI